MNFNKIFFLIPILFFTSILHATKKQELKKQLAVVRENPNSFDAMYKTSQLLIDLKQNDHALYFLDRAISLNTNNKSDKVKINNDLAVLLLELGNRFFAEGKAVQAVSAFKKLAGLEQTYDYFHHNIGFTLARHLGKHYEAMEHYKKAMKSLATNSETDFCYAMSCLATGNFHEGWEQYKSRWQRKHKAPRSFAYPLEKMWIGENLKGKTVLIRCEQGLGDTFHFIRYAQLLKQQGATVIVETQKPLIKILSLCPYIDKLIPIGQSLPIFDYQIPLLDLPAVFETTLKTIPNKIPYLYSDEKLEEEWSNKIADNGKLKIGLCWHGHSAHGQSKFMPLKEFIPILQMKNIQFYSLQKNTGLDQLNDLPEGINIRIFDDLDTKHGSFMDTAAIMKQLDLIITADTSTAHLAGALGIPTWIILPFPAEWRWLMYRKDCPWYPTMKLFRQKKPGDWSPVQQELLEKLKRLKNKLLSNSAGPEFLSKQGADKSIEGFKSAFFYAQQGNYQKALDLYETLLQNDPENMQLMFDKAYVLKKLHKYDEAINLYETVFDSPNYNHNPKVKLSASHAYLIKGQFEKGFELFEYRWFYPPSYNQTLKKNINNLKNKTVLLKTEFGLGDTMQFIRYTQLLKEKGATIVVESQKPLMNLLSLCPYIDKVVTKKDQYSKADYTCQLMSLPFVFDTTVKTVPQTVPYLYHDKKLERKWSHHIGKNSFNIGVCWHADPHKNSENNIVKKDGESKSIPLKLLAELSELENVRLYSLQKIDGLDQLKKLPNHQIVHRFGKNFDVTSGSFMDTAAVMKQLDLVLTIDTSVAHLAGALAVPVWVLLPHTADWRWLLERDDSPWYPTMKLFRQPKLGDWKTVIKNVKENLIYSFTNF